MAINPSRVIVIPVVRVLFGTAFQSSRLRPGTTECHPVPRQFPSSAGGFLSQIGPRKFYITKTYLGLPTRRVAPDPCPSGACRRTDEVNATAPRLRRGATESCSIKSCDFVENRCIPKPNIAAARLNAIADAHPHGLSISRDVLC